MQGLQIEPCWTSLAMVHRLTEQLNINDRQTSRYLRGTVLKQQENTKKIGRPLLRLTKVWQTIGIFRSKSQPREGVYHIQQPRNNNFGLRERTSQRLGPLQGIDEVSV